MAERLIQCCIFIKTGSKSHRIFESKAFFSNGKSLVFDTIQSFENQLYSRYKEQKIQEFYSYVMSRFRWKKK